LLAVDCGRYGVKAVSGSKKITFPSIVGEWRERKISSGGNYELTINGEKFFVGELAQQESRYARDMTIKSKIHEETKILTLAAIGLLTDCERIQLVTGLPVDQHTEAIKRQLKQLLSGVYDIEINGRKRHITLAESNIIVSIEGAGAYVAENLPSKCRIIDAGSRTINTLTIDENKKYRDLQSGTLDYGCMDLQADDKTEAFSRRIIADLSKLWVSYNGEPVLLSGGGAEALQPYLSKQFNTKVANNAVYAYALGYQAMGAKIWQSNA
jgi:plasmid segregation protein ParM